MRNRILIFFTTILLLSFTTEVVVKAVYATFEHDVTMIQIENESNESEENESNEAEKKEFEEKLIQISHQNIYVNRKTTYLQCLAPSFEPAINSSEFYLLPEIPPELI